MNDLGGEDDLGLISELFSRRGPPWMNVKLFGTTVDECKFCRLGEGKQPWLIEKIVWAKRKTMDEC